MTPFLNNAKKIKDDSLISFRLSKVDDPPTFKIRRDLLDTSNMSDNIILEKVSNQRQKPPQSRRNGKWYYQ